MAEDRILFQNARFVVTDSFLRTPRKTYKLRDIDYIQIKRPWFLMAVAGGTLLLGWAAAFWDLLYVHERALLLGGTLLSMYSTSCVGTLVVHSWSLRGGELEDAILWDISTVREIRAAIDEAMIRRADHPNPTSTAKGGSADDR